MDEKPKVNLRRFQSEKMKAKYVLKFGLYVLVFVSLLIWYNKQKNDQRQKNNNVTIETNKPEDIELKGLEIEP
jgi:hypothetical protein